MILLKDKNYCVNIDSDILHMKFSVEQVDCAPYNSYPDSLAMLLNSDGKLISEEYLVYFNSSMKKEYKYYVKELYVPGHIGIPIYDKRPCDPDFSVFGEMNTNRFSIHFNNIIKDVSRIEFLVNSDNPYRFVNTSLVLSDCKTEISKFYDYNKEYNLCTLCAVIQKDNDNWFIDINYKKTGIDLFEYIKSKVGE